jgi:hypothetical protein
MEFISIGPYCITAEILKNFNLRLKSYPFDYIFSSLELVKHSINDNFNIFLDKKYLTKGTNNNSTRHEFYCNFLDTQLLYLHHIKNNFPSDYKVSSGDLFFHHNLIDNNIYEKFKKRCDRLINLITNNNKIVFVYYNCYTNDVSDLINFYNNFIDNKNIFVLGIFENGCDKKILYENLNCKIYQNYELEFIFNEIKMWEYA